MNVFRYALPVPPEVASWFPALWLGGLAAVVVLGLRVTGRRSIDRPDAALLTVAALLLASTVGPALVTGGALLPLDMLRDDPVFAGLPPASPPGNYVQHDLLVMIGPALAAVRRAVAAGEWPLWHAEAGAGMPLLADPQSQALQPLAWLALAVGPLDAFAVAAGLRVLLACVFFALFLRRLGVHAVAAAFGGLVYAGGGFLQMWLGWPLANVAAWLPVGLYLMTRLAADPAARGVRLALAVAGLGLATAGHPESQLHAGLALGCVFAWLCSLAPRGRRLRLLWAAAWSAGVAALLAAPGLLTAAGYLGESKRATMLTIRPPDAAAERWAARLAPVVALNAQGNDRFLDYWGPRNINEDGGGFAGTPALVLAGAALLGAGRRWRRGERALVIGLLGFALLVVARPPPLAAWLRELPLFAQSAADHQRALLLVLLAVAWLAARTLDDCTAAGAVGRVRLLLAAGGLAAGVAAAFASFPPPPGSPLAAFHADWLARQTKFLVATAGVLLATSWAQSGAARGWPTRLRALRLATLGQLAVVALAALELHYAFAPAHPVVPRALATARPPALAALEAELAASGDPLARVLGLARSLAPNVGSWWSLPDARSQNPAAPWGYAVLSAPLEEVGLGSDLGPLLGLLDRLHVTLLSGPAKGPTPPGFDLAYVDASTRIWRRRARAVTLSDARAAVVRREGAAIFAHAERRGRQELPVAATSGWRGLADGAPTPSGAGRDGALLALGAPRSGAELVALYRPRGFFLGALAAAIGTTLWVVAALGHPRRSRRSAADGRSGLRAHRAAG